MLAFKRNRLSKFIFDLMMIASTPRVVIRSTTPSSTNSAKKVLLRNVRKRAGIYEQ